MASREGALTSWANTGDRQSRTKPGRDAFLARFEREVDPGGVLPESERIERAALLRRAHMLRLSRLSAQARRGKALARGGQQGVQPGEEDDGCATISIHARNRAGQGSRPGEQSAS